jgi:GntR family transcriptional regulator of arabinose operon
VKTEHPKELALLHVPLYSAIETDMRSRIQSGQWSAGGMIPSRHLLAEEYRVDVRTIQRAITNLLADGTLWAHGGRGTFVSVSDCIASGIKSTRRSVMVIAEQSCDQSTCWPAFIQAVYEGLRKHIADCPILTFNTADRTLDDVVRHEQEALWLAETGGYSGVIMFHCGGEATLPDIQRALQSKVPIVFIDRLPFEYGCDYVGVDNRSGAREAVEYLLSIGHRRIAFIAPEERVSTINDRLNGYLDAFASAGMPPPGDLILRICLSKSFSPQGVQSELCRIAAHMVQLPEPPTAIFAVNDYIAEHLVLVLQCMEIDLPKTISIIGFDGVESSLAKKPKLTTVKQPFQAIGDRAAAMLCWRMSHPSASVGTYQHVVLQTRLVIQDSTQPVSD